MFGTQRVVAGLLAFLQVPRSRAAPSGSHSDAEPHPSVRLEVRAERSILQVLRDRALVPEGPQRIDDAHEPGQSEQGAREEEPAGACLLFPEHVDVCAAVQRTLIKPGCTHLPSWDQVVLSMKRQLRVHPRTMARA